MPSKIKTTTIKEGERIPYTEYRHQYAIDYLTQCLRNLELEIAQKKRAINTIISDRGLDQTPVHFMGFKARKMSVEYKRLERSIALLTKNNKPVKLNSHTIAKSNQTI